jgi:integrase
VKYSNKGTRLQDLVEGFLFSLQAEGRSSQTHAYYFKLLGCLLRYSKSQSWPDRVDNLEVRHFREFLSWISSRSFEYTAGNNCRRLAQPRPSKAWRYYKAIRRLFNWSVEEGLLKDNPDKGIRFKAPPPPPIQPYSLDELKRFLAVCELDIKTGARFCGLRNRAPISNVLACCYTKASLAKEEGRGATCPITAEATHTGGGEAKFKPVGKKL